MYSNGYSLYHTKRYKGTTTGERRKEDGCRLYHTKRYKGTTTLSMAVASFGDYIIPKDIRELRRLSP